MVFFLAGGAMALIALVMVAWSVRQMDYRYADIGRVFLVVLSVGLAAGIVIDGSVFAGIALLLLAQSTLTVGVVLARSKSMKKRLVSIRMSDFQCLVKSQQPDS